MKVEPWPGTERTWSSPPSSRAISRLIERPRPVPPYLRLVVPSACWNASKISFCLSCGMPMPVSLTEISIASSTSRRIGWLGLQPSAAVRTERVTAPCAVNLNALDKRLRTTCWSRFSSVRMVAGSASSNSTWNARPFSDASWRKVRSICCLRPESGMSPISIETVPDSIFDRSRMSLMRLSRSVPAP